LTGAAGARLVPSNFDGPDGHRPVESFFLEDGELAEQDKRAWEHIRMLLTQVCRVLPLFEQLISFHEAGEDGDEFSGEIVVHQIGPIVRVDPYQPVDEVSLA
jgi:hypothetical protein